MYPSSATNESLAMLVVSWCRFVVQDKVTVSYNVLWNTFKRISTELYGEGPCVEKAALFHGTATKVYKLKLVDNQQQEKL